MQIFEYSGHRLLCTRMSCMAPNWPIHLGSLATMQYRFWPLCFFCHTTNYLKPSLWFLLHHHVRSDVQYGCLNCMWANAPPEMCNPDSPQWQVWSLWKLVQVTANGTVENWNDYEENGLVCWIIRTENKPLGKEDSSWEPVLSKGSRLPGDAVLWPPKCPELEQLQDAIPRAATRNVNHTEFDLHSERLSSSWRDKVPSVVRTYSLDRPKTTKQH